MRDAPTHIRLVVVAAFGLVCGVIAARIAPWQFALLAGWDATAAAFVAWVWVGVGRFTPEETRRFATREDPGRVWSSLLLLSASVASLVGAAFDLLKASQAEGRGRVALTAIGLATITLSWTIVHTLFALRYAHEYYTVPVGGIDFKTDNEPDYQDFAYIAFTIGMTFQVSDTDVQARAIRRTVLRHALLAYLFGAVILAVAINLVASLIR